MPWVSFPLIRRLALAGLFLLPLPQAASAKRLIYSYDSISPITEQMTENGLTFVFDKGIMATRVLKIIETQDVGEAGVRISSDHDLGVSLYSLLGDQARGHDLYEIEPADNGAALVQALCPGAEHGFLAIGPLKPGRDLTIYALGRLQNRSWLCVTLDYGFHGAWSLPVSLPLQPDRTDRFNDAPTNRPY